MIKMFMLNLIKDFKGLILSQTAKDSSVIFLGNGISVVLGIIITILAARHLGPENWGVAAAVLSFIIMLSAIADFGFGSGLFRFVSKYLHQGRKDRANDILQTIFSIRLISAVLIAAILIVFANFISATFFKTNDSYLIIIGGVGLLGLLLLDFQIASFQAKQSFRLAAIFISLTNIVRLGLLLGLIYLSSLTLFNLLLIYFASSLIVFLFSWILSPIVLKISKDWKEDVKEIFLFSGWMGLNRVMGVVGSRVDVLLLLQLGTPVEAGIFAAAKQLSSGVPLIFGSFATVLAPRFASYEGNNLRHFYKKSLLLSIMLAGGLLVGVFLCGPIISLFGDKYTASVLVLQLLLIGLIPFALSTPSVNYLIYSAHKPRIIGLMTLFQLPFIILGNLYFIPKLGVLSPVIIAGLVNLSTLLVTYYLCLRILKR